MQQPQDAAVRRLMWFFAIVFAVEGAGQAKVGLIWQPLLYFLKEARGWSPVDVSASLAVLDIPWMIKPLYGAMSDFVPLFGYRRRSYLLVSSVAVVAAYAWVAQLSDPRAIIAALVVTAVALAVASTICGALLVEAGQRHSASAHFVNQQWLWFNIAVMASSGIGGALTQYLHPAAALHTAAWIAGILPLMVVGSILLVHEDRTRADIESLRQRLSGFLATFRSPTLRVIAGFLLFYYFSPGFGTPLYYHLTDHLAFSQGFIGALSSATAAGWIAGGLLYHYRPPGLGQLGMLRLGIILGAGSTLAYVGLVDPVTAVVVYFLTGVAGMVANVATLTLVSDHCPEGAEGFAFAALMSVINLATPLADLTGSLLYEHVFGGRLTPLILVSAGFTAAILLFLPLLPVRPSPRPL